MIQVKVEIYSPIKDCYVPIEAIVDTGATLCAIAKHNAESLGLHIEKDKLHLEVA